jgi:hypothetical protein
MQREVKDKLAPPVSVVCRERPTARDARADGRGPARLGVIRVGLAILCGASGCSISRAEQELHVAPGQVICRDQKLALDYLSKHADLTPDPAFQCWPVPPSARVFELQVVSPNMGGHRMIAVRVVQPNFPPFTGYTFLDVLPPAPPKAGDVAGSEWRKIEGGGGTTLAIDMKSVVQYANGYANAMMCVVENGVCSQGTISQLLFDCHGYVMDVGRGDKIPLPAPPRSAANKMASLACTNPRNTNTNGDNDAWCGLTFANGIRARMEDEKAKWLTATGAEKQRLAEVIANLDRSYNNVLHDYHLLCAPR